MDGVFGNISPLDHRYRSSQVWTDLAPYLSEEANIRYQLKVEAALVQALSELGMAPAEAAPEVWAAIDRVTAGEVAQEEEKTRHNIRALVNCIRAQVPDETKPFIHFSATSADIMDSANALRYKLAVIEVLIPLLVRLETTLIRLAEREAGTVQIGRTHGQYAVPVTFGFALAQYVDRLGGRIQALRATAGNLRGKLAGAVGAYNAGSLFIPDPVSFEVRVMEILGLSASPISTQVVQPEFLADLMHALISAFGVLANLSDDFRHLQRSEIAEVGEYFAPEQVGSSTMPHKRNPWNFEHVKSMWKEFMPRMMTVYMDQISEHQRDLTNSASARFVVEIILGLGLAAERLLQVMSKVSVIESGMRANMEKAGEMFIAEPLYLLLAFAGHPDAHEASRQLTLAAEKSGSSLRELLAQSPELKPYLAKLSPEQQLVLFEPERYTGQAREKCLTITNHWRSSLAIEG